MPATFRLLLPFVAVALIAASAPVSAAAQRAFVASFGGDGNTCSFAAPCRTFDRAITQTNDGGEVIVLDSAGYGPVTITQSVKIIAPSGVYAGVSVASGDGIAVNGSGITVALRGLTVNGQGGSVGIHFVQGATLHVENCVISGFTATGNTTNSGLTVDAPSSRIYVNDTIIRDNHNGMIVTAQTEANRNVGIISRTRFENNTVEGIEFLGSAQFTIEDSVVAGSLYNIDVFPLLAATNALLDIARTQVQGGGTGLYVEPGNATSLAYVHIVDSTISGHSGYGVAITPLGVGQNCIAHVVMVRTQVVNGTAGLLVDGNSGAKTNAFLDGDILDGNTGPGFADVLVRNGGLMYTRQNNIFITQIPDPSGHVFPFAGL